MKTHWRQLTKRNVWTFKTTSGLQRNVKIMDTISLTLSLLQFESKIWLQLLSKNRHCKGIYHFNYKPNTGAYVLHPVWTRTDIVRAFTTSTTTLMKAGTYGIDECLQTGLRKYITMETIVESKDSLWRKVREVHSMQCIEIMLNLLKQHHIKQNQQQTLHSTIH